MLNIYLCIGYLYLHLDLKYNIFQFNANAIRTQQRDTNVHDDRGRSHVRARPIGVDATTAHRQHVVGDYVMRQRGVVVGRVLGDGANAARTVRRRRPDEVDGHAAGGLEDQQNGQLVAAYGERQAVEEQAALAARTSRRYPRTTRAQVVLAHDESVHVANAAFRLPRTRVVDVGVA